MVWVLEIVLNWLVFVIIDSDMCCIVCLRGILSVFSVFRCVMREVIIKFSFWVGFVFRLC